VRTAVLAVVAFAAGASGGTWSSVLIGKARAEATGEIELRVPERGLVFRSLRGVPGVLAVSPSDGAFSSPLDNRL
jgi:hypothetical protein